MTTIPAGQGPHYAFKDAKVAERVLTVGDPNRAEQAARHLEGAVEVFNRREYRGFTGAYKGQEISICSHGVGCGGAAYLFTNLFTIGVKTIIRAGTCGMFVKAPPGTTVIGTGAVRAEGASQYILPIEFPAIADRRVANALVDAAVSAGADPVVEGIIHTSMLLFSYPARPYQLGAYGDANPDSGRLQLADAGVVAVENEYAMLLVQAAAHGARAGGVFTGIVNRRENPSHWAYPPYNDDVLRGIERMIVVALDALAAL